MIEMGLWAAVAPLMLLLLSSLWSYPAVLEEVVKWAILRYGGAKLPTTREGVMVGAVFGVAESVLYTSNAWMSGQWGAMGLRLILTVPMHAVSALVIAYGLSKRLGWLGVMVAMIIHATFNYLVR